MNSLNTNIHASIIVNYSNQLIKYICHRRPRMFDSFDCESNNILYDIKIKRTSVIYISYQGSSDIYVYIAKNELNI